ncbi:DUF427 domain-containing protein [Mesorhizobium sp. B2-3-5]|nr:DUF427 domain-containing protein [Mesorhizobium sp. B2-3-5]
MLAYRTLLSGSNHAVTVEDSLSRIVVFVAGRVMDDSRQTFRLYQPSRPPRHYLSVSDVKMTFLTRSSGTDQGKFSPRRLHLVQRKGRPRSQFAGSRHATPPTRSPSKSVATSGACGSVKSTRLKLERQLLQIAKHHPSAVQLGSSHRLSGAMVEHRLCPLPAESVIVSRWPGLDRDRKNV